MERDGRNMVVHRRARVYRVALLMVGLILVMGAFVGVVLAAPVILSPTPATPIQTFVDPNTGSGDALTFSIGINESANASWYVNGTLDSAANQTGTSATYSNATLQRTVGVHTIMVVVSNANGTDNHTWVWTVSYAPPYLTGKRPQSPVSTTTGQAITFNITSNQTVDFTWYVNDGTTNTSVQTNTSATTASYSPSSYASTAGSYTVVVVARNSTTGVSSSESWTWTVSPPLAPSLSSPAPSSPLQSYVGDSQPTFSIVVDQSVNVSWWVNGVQDTSKAAYNASGVSGTLSYTPDTALANTTSPDTYTIEVKVENANGSDSYSWTWRVLAWGAPAIVDYYPNGTSTITSIEGATAEFGIKANQSATIYWVIDGTTVSSSSVNAGDWGKLIKSDLAIGTHTVSAYATNSNGTSSPRNWTWNVVPKTYYTGDSVWRQGETSPTYTWTTQSFAGFYYDIDDDVGSEQLVFNNINAAGRSVARGDIVYTTSPSQVHYNYSTWGKYEVIGFMADKYFVGYLDMPNGTGIENTLSSGQLHKVLMDDDAKRSVYVGASLPLKEGYELFVREVDINGNRALVELRKDGEVVDTAFVASNEDYIYKKDVGSAHDLPIIIVRIGSVFRGTETNVVLMNAVFQISESYTSVSSGQKYGIMKVTSYSSTKIEMKSDSALSLSRGSISTLMGNIKVQVADSPTVRFKLALDLVNARVDIVRGTVANGTFKWTPYNFDGFYYDLDTDTGSETLEVLSLSGRSIPAHSLRYTSTAQQTRYEYSTWGKYEVIGFMADKYFVGYLDMPNGTGIENTLSSGQLHKVLMDDDAKRSVYVGASLPLKEGYELFVREVDINGNRALVELRKDGEVVDTAFVASNEDYIYKKDVGSAHDLPIIIVRIGSVFRGTETNVVLMNAVFQISESYTSVSSGQSFREMEVVGVNSSSITLENPSAISLWAGSNIDILGDVWIRVADDSSALRYCPFVKIEELVSGALPMGINVPPTVSRGEQISIHVVSGLSDVEGASIFYDGELIGTTNVSGVLLYTPTELGKHTIEARCYGYAPTSTEIVVTNATLELMAPSSIDLGDTLVVQVGLEGRPVENATIKLDDTVIGYTDASGTLTYVPKSAGTFTLSVEKAGFISNSTSLEVVGPYANLVVSSLSVEPKVVKAGKSVAVVAIIVNNGNLKGTKLVEVKLDGKVVHQENITLAPGENATLTYAQKIEGEGTHVLEVGGKVTTITVEGSALPLGIGGVIGAVVGAGIVILVLIVKGIIPLGEGGGELVERIRELISRVLRR